MFVCGFSCWKARKLLGSKLCWPWCFVGYDVACVCRFSFCKFAKL